MTRKFSLRLLFGLCALVAAIVGYWDAQAKRQMRVTQAVVQLEGRITYEESGWPVPRFLIDALGPDYFCHIKSITLYPTEDSPADQQVRVLEKLPHVRRLAIWPGAKGRMTALSDAPGGLSDEGLAYLLKHFPQLEHLSLLSTRFTAEGAQRLDDQHSIVSLQYDNHSDFGKRYGGR